jgi:hypothetical protein
MIASRIAAWIWQGNRRAAMDLALDVTDLETYAYSDDAQGLADFLADVECARDAVLNLCELVPAHVQPDLDHALDEIECALTGEGTIDDRLHDMVNANGAVERANRALTTASTMPGQAALTGVLQKRVDFVGTND